MFYLVFVNWGKYGYDFLVQFLTWGFCWGFCAPRARMLFPLQYSYTLKSIDSHRLPSFEMLRRAFSANTRYPWPSQDPGLGDQDHAILLSTGRMGESQEWHRKTFFLNLQIKNFSWRRFSGDQPGVIFWLKMENNKSNYIVNTDIMSPSHTIWSIRVVHIQYMETQINRTVDFSLQHSKMSQDQWRNHLTWHPSRLRRA